MGLVLGQARRGRAGLWREGSGRGEVEPMPQELRGVGGSGEAEGPAPASGRARRAEREWGPEEKTGEAGSGAGGLLEAE